MSNIPNKFKPVPFWSWNDELDEDELVRQIEWMHENGIGGFFMHARGGLTTPYLKEKWFSCIEACLKKAKELDMEAYAYDENGWPSGFVGGLLLEDELNRDMNVTYKRGAYDPNSVIAYDESTDELIPVTSGDNVLNIYLNITASTADILNKDVVRKFLDLTHEQYKKHDKYGNLRGFFTDEPQYSRWGTPYTRVLKNYFLEHYNENVIDRIGLLFSMKKGYEDYRYKYYKALQDLMLNSFAKQIYDWCDENGYKLTGHYIEENSLGAQILCCAGIMPFYEYEHIPGIDYLDRFLRRTPSRTQLGSVMAQLDKKEGLCEMFACAGWDVTPIELKVIAELVMNAGVTMVCHHLLPYSEHGQRKRDYPSHYSKINPWVDKGFKFFNDHFSNIAQKIATFKEIVNVAILQPIRTGYFYYQHELNWGYDFGVRELSDNFSDINETLYKYGVPHHIIDETIMAKHAHVEGDELVVGKCRYRYIVIPKGTLTMDVTTEKLFREFANNGGKFYVVGDIPTYLEGKKYNHDYMKNNCSLEEIVASKEFYSSYNDDICLSYRISDDNQRFIYAVNTGNETDIEIRIPGYTSFECEGEILSNKIHFNKGESKFLKFSNLPIKEESPKEVLKLGNKFKVVGSPINYLTLDKMAYSFDGINFFKKAHYMGVFYNLLKKEYSGDLYLKYDFEIKDIPSICEVLLEDTHTLEVKINGYIVNKKGTVLEKDLWVYDIASFLKEGNNEILIKMNFYESSQVYYALFGENVTESFKNCLAYDTTIEAIYLRGDFSVDGDFKKGETSPCYIANNFYISKRKDEVSSLVLDGYPFFRGNIVLEQEVEVDNVNKVLEFSDRFQMIDVYCNDKFVKRLMFDYKVDLSSYLKVGKNKITLDYVVSNRNLLGPHHHELEEPLSVGPHTFERLHTWDENGESPICLKRYSFVEPLEYR